jgi:hypothetical protein
MRLPCGPIISADLNYRSPHGGMPPQMDILNRRQNLLRDRMELNAQ